MDTTACQQVNSCTYLLASGKGSGALSVFRIRGSTSSLQTLDSAATRRQLPVGAAVYTELHDSGQSRVDQVLWCVPSESERLITGHGGAACTTALTAWLEGRGASPEALLLSGESFPSEAAIAERADARLCHVGTEAQAAVLLAARAGLRKRYERMQTLSAHAQEAEREAWNHDGLVANELLSPQQIVLAGPTNAGKSTIFNTLVAHERALVSPEPGTTRDAIHAGLDLGGWQIELVDTAGLGTALDALDAAAQATSLERLALARLVLFVYDQSQPFPKSEYKQICAQGNTPILSIANKSDLAPAALPDDAPPPDLTLSAFDADRAARALVNQILCHLGPIPMRPSPIALDFISEPQSR